MIVLGANIGGGVMEWKGAREWAIERDSMRNKKKYAANWGYELDIVDLSTKKRYAHEWRESWEKVDYVREALKKYPDAEWLVSSLVSMRTNYGPARPVWLTDALVARAHTQDLVA